MSSHSTISRYQLHETIGQGGMGIVHRATDRLTGATVALKRIQLTQQSMQKNKDSNTAQEQARLSLAHEFKTLASLRHPNIISVLDYGFDEDRQPYLAMSLLENTQTLYEATQNASKDEQLALIIQVLQALAYMHRRGIIHRDLKPNNILVEDKTSVKVLDFGLAIEQDQSNETAGTLAFLAPEVINGAGASRESDLYAIGVMTYEILTGMHPFEAPRIQDMINLILNGAIDLNPIPETLRPIIGKLLEKERRFRYQDAETIIRDLCHATNLPLPVESIAIRESFLQTAKFVGRQAEFTQLSQALKKAMEGQGSTWLVSGESGVGKTRLLQELRTFAMVRGALVVSGEVTAGKRLPYQAWRDALPRLVLSVDLPDHQASILKEIVPNIGILLNRPIADAPHLDAKSSQQRLITTIADLFKRQPYPIALLMEDLQWARESLLPLRHLHTIAEGLPLLIIASYRDDERPDIPGELPNANHIKLERLTQESIEELSVSMLGDIGHESRILNMLQRETEGNVFFLIESVRALAEEAGRLSDIAEITLPARILTGGIREMVLHRLERVPDLMKPLLNLAAIAGRKLDLRLLRDFAADIDLDLWLYICADAAILELQDQYWHFAHEKIREAIVDNLASDERSLLHTCIAQSIEKHYSDNSDYAHSLMIHWREAGNKEKELHYLLQLGNAMLNMGTYRETRALMLNGLELVGNQDSLARMQLLKILGESTFQLSQYPQAAAHYEESLAIAERMNDVTGIGEAQIRMGTINQYLGNYAIANDFYERVFDNPDIRLRARAKMGRGWNVQRMGNTVEAANDGAQSLILFRQLNDMLGTANALTLLSTISISQGDYINAKNYSEESLELQEALSNRKGMAANLNNLGMITYQLGDDEKAFQHYKSAFEIDQEIGHRLGQGMCLTDMGMVKIQQNKFAEAERLLNQAQEIFTQINYRFGLGHALHLLGIISLTEQVFDEAQDYFLEALEILHDIKAHQEMASIYCDLMEVQLKRKQRENALHSLQSALVLAMEINIPAITLRVVLAMARYEWSQHKKLETIELLGYVKYHPQADRECQNDTQRFLKELQEYYTQSELEDGFAEGKLIQNTPMDLVILLDSRLVTR